MQVSWNWLKEYLGETTLTAEQAAELLGRHSFEIEDMEQVDDDTVIAVDVLPNRSSDSLCHRGVARELASITGIPLAHDPLREYSELTTTDSISVDIADAHACPRFTAALIKEIEVTESPQWLKKRLEAIGQRSINNIVDATNYVMFALGQPLHAYDADLFAQQAGQWRFAVRYARAGEQVSLIAEGGKDEDRIVECVGTELLIVDASTDTPIGLAGVKGGRYAGVHEGTQNVIIEAAHFNPTITRKTARRLGIVIDASKRFENEPSRELPGYAQADIIALIADIADGRFEGWVDEYVETLVSVEVTVDPARAAALLGLPITKLEAAKLLERIGATVTDRGDVLSVVGPFERTDLAIEEDMIEEIGRLHGYTSINAISPSPRVLTEYNTRHFYSEQIRGVLIGLGFSEVITSSFRKKDQVQLKNALASDKSYLRSDLTKNLTAALERNAGFTDLLGTADTRLFEIGTVFYKTETGIGEHVSLALGVRTKQSGYIGKDDRPCDEALSAISNALGIAFPATGAMAKKSVEEDGVKYMYTQGVVEVNLTALLRRLPEPQEYAAVPPGVETIYRPFSSFPHVTRDIALWTTEGTTPADVEAVLNTHAGDLRIRTTLFDEFTKDGRTSYAFRLVFQSNKKTLTDAEVNAVMEHVHAAVADHGWEVR